MTTSTAPAAYRRRTRMAPSGRMVSSAVASPAIRTYPHLGRAGATVCAAVAIVTSSNTAQPRHCRMFRAVGRYDSRAPNSPRSRTMAGAPVRAPGSPASARAAVPSTVPATIAVSAAAMDSSGVPGPPGWSTKMAPVKPSRLTPRLPHRPNWSSRLSACGTGSARVRATSERRSPGTVTKVSFWSVVVAVTAASLRRHYPDRFGRSVARSATLSARCSPSSRVFSSPRMVPLRLFAGEQAAGGFGDVGGVDAGGAEELGGGAGAGHLADGQVGDGQVGAAGAGQGVEDRGAETALGMVVLGDDQPSAGGRGGGGERGGVRRLDRVQVDDPGADAVGGQLAGGGQALMQGDPGADQGHLVVIGLAQHLGPADREGLPGVVQHRVGAPGGPHVGD